MPRRWQLVFDLYATRSDYESIIMAVEAQRNLKYVLYGMFETSHSPTFYSGLDIPNLGIALSGIAVQESNFVVLNADTETKVREIDLHRGGIRYSVSQLENPTSITFQPGGMFENHCLVKGDVATVSRDPASVALYRLFSREFRKRFTNVQDYWLGPEALQLFKQGMRLTDDVRSPVKYDLKPEPLALPP